MPEEEINAEVSQEAPKNLEERMDDLEDLISVEQAGILELKKMLESGAAVSVQVPGGLEERLSKIEEEVSKIGQVPGVEVGVPTDLTGRLQAVESELETVKQQASSIPPNVGQLDQKIAELNIVKNNLESSQKAVDEILKNTTDTLKSLQNFKTMGEDISRQAARIEGFYDSMNKKHDDMEKRMSSIESKIEGLKPEHALSNMQSLFNQLNEKIESKLGEMDESLDQRIQDAQTPVMEQEVKQLIEKVVQLETRILVLERMTKQSVAVSPVILE